MNWHVNTGDRPHKLIDTDRIVARLRNGIETIPMQVRVSDQHAVRWNHAENPFDIIDWRMA